MFIFCTQYVLLFANPNASVYYEYTSDGYALFADNEELCPITVQVELDLINMKLADGDRLTNVVPPNVTKHKILDVVVINRLDLYSFTYTKKLIFGDFSLESYDAGFLYYLPFKKGSSFRVKQGYLGSFSHQNTYAIDFEMSEGTQIYAAREGTVVEVVQENNTSCSAANCEEYDNYILVYHPDGTFAKYAHIRQNGAVISTGDAIAIGQHIGYSGNVGRTNGGTLHIEVYKLTVKGPQTLKTNFLIDDGQDHSILNTSQRYFRNY
ncbi:M23 family metallopeptidase [Ulvibacter litoralis]|uniref:Peptidase family M23 n=1 Tax=Ulvibacter litoralis TaxID=227084 RepID=A0A1G7GBF7_9FLAO|nr:M23 family metallopeptidase [Ulvibacter litoralis]SDE85437.1 Peptidase family M23 [Ulvibacter litoralis]